MKYVLQKLQSKVKCLARLLLTTLKNHGEWENQGDGEWGDGDGDLSTGKEQVLNWVIFENREPVGRKNIEILSTVGTECTEYSMRSKMTGSRQTQLYSDTHTQIRKPNEERDAT
jgi:hypothetical protein